MNNWPDPTQPGVPLNPEQNGAHMLTHVDDDAILRGPWILLWCAPERLWTDLYGNRDPADRLAQFVYVGPCVTPDLHTAQLAEAAHTGFQHAVDRILAEVELDCRANGRFADHQGNQRLLEMAQTLRNQGAKFVK